MSSTEYGAGDAELSRWEQQMLRGDFAELRQYLLRSQREEDWQDRVFVLNWLMPFFRADVLLAASAAESNAADLSLLLGAFYFYRIGESRGARAADQTSSEQFEDAATQLQRMMNCLGKVSAATPNDPTPHVYALRGLVIFSNYEDYVKQEYAEAVRLAPDCLPAHYGMVNARAEKWGGSHAEALALARSAMQSGKPGSDLPACLFLAHFLVWQYARIFDKNKAEADRYLKDPHVNQELNAALSRWTSGGYQPRRSSLPYLHQAALWYYLCGDQARLRQIFTLTGNARCDQVWKQIGDPVKFHGTALLQTLPIQKKKTGLFGWLKP